MIQTDVNSLRNRLVEAGISHDLAHHPTKGAVLANLLGQRLEGEEPSVAVAAEAAGVDASTPRQWRIRDEVYRHAEWKARRGEGPELETETSPPEPGKVKDLLERHQRAAAVCRSMGAGPWNLKTRSAREWNTGAYTENYEVAIETARELKAHGITEGVTIPPPMRPYPPERRPRPRPLSDGYLWPVSLNPQLHRQRRG